MLSSSQAIPESSFASPVSSSSSSTSPLTSTVIPISSASGRKRGRPAKNADSPADKAKIPRLIWTTDIIIKLLQLRFQDEQVHNKFLKTKNNNDKTKAWDNLALRFSGLTKQCWTGEQVN